MAKIMTHQQFKAVMTPVISKYVPASHRPTPKQLVFMSLGVKEAGYGGATGGGKSDALLMDALQGVHIPGYASMLLRKNYSDLALPGALMDRAHEWWSGTDARWIDKTKTWEFPTDGKEKATISFGFMETYKDRLRYQGSELQHVGFDETTQFEELQYLYLFSRLRYTKVMMKYMEAHGIFIPLKIRSATNPGGPGHIWYKNRFITSKKVPCKIHPLYDGVNPPTNDCKSCMSYFDAVHRVFVPSGLKDNPHIEYASYIENLKELDPITREQYINGNWDVTEGGGMFSREWFLNHADGARHVHSAVWIKKNRAYFSRVVRYWDLAGTKVSTINPDPDYTAGVLLGLSEDGRVFILDVRRIRDNPGEVEKFLVETAEEDYADWGDIMIIRGEQEPGSSGKFVKKILTDRLSKYDVRFTKSYGKKYLRARPFASACFNGKVHIVNQASTPEFLDELEMFSDQAIGHDDMVDAASGAYKELRSNGGMTVSTSDDTNDPNGEEGETLIETEVELDPTDLYYNSPEYKAAIERAKDSGFGGGV